MGLKTWPILVLRMEGGPDDGETRLMPAADSVVPPERLRASREATGGYERHPELPEPWTWRYVCEPDDGRDE